MSGREPEAQGRRLCVDCADEFTLAPSGQPRIGLGTNPARIRLTDASGDGVEREVHPGGPHFLGERAEVRLAPGEDSRVDVDMRVLVRPEGVGSPHIGEEVDLAEVRAAGLREAGAQLGGRLGREDQLRAIGETALPLAHPRAGPGEIPRPIDPRVR